MHRLLHASCPPAACHVSQPSPWKPSIAQFYQPCMPHCSPPLIRTSWIPARKYSATHGSHTQSHQLGPPCFTTGCVQSGFGGLSACLLQCYKQQLCLDLPHAACCGKHCCNGAHSLQLYDEAGIPSRWAFSPVGSNYQTYNLQGLQSTPGEHDAVQE